jgi:hypothetical protein
MAAAQTVAALIARLPVHLQRGIAAVALVPVANLSISSHNKRLITVENCPRRPPSVERMKSATPFLRRTSLAIKIES